MVGRATFADKTRVNERSRPPDASQAARGTKNIDFSKSLGMALTGVENVGAPRGSIFNLSRGPQLPLKKQNVGPTLFYF